MSLASQVLATDSQTEKTPPAASEGEGEEQQVGRREGEATAGEGGWRKREKK